MSPTRSFPPRSSPPRPGRSRVGPWFLIPAACLWFAALLAAPATLAGQFPGELHGRVVNAISGEGVAGARVTVAGTGQVVRAGGDGSFRARGLEDGTVRVTVTAPGYLPAARAVSIRHGATVHEVFPLEPRLVELAEMDVNVPAGAGIRLDREAISRSGARTMGELLEGVPGVVLRRQGPGGTEEASLRGSGSERVLVLVDGVPLNDPMSGRADLSSLPAAAVTDVEILPGARGARYGPGALGGVIRIRTGGAGSGGEATLRTGSLGEIGGGGAVTGALGSLDAEVAAQLHRLDGGFSFDRDELLGGGTDRRRNGDLRQGTFHLALASAGSGPGRWQLRATADGLSRGIPGKSYAPSPRARQSRGRVSAQGRWETRVAGLPLELTAHHVHQEVRFRDPAPPLGLPFDTRSRLRGSGLEVEATPRPLLEGGVSLGGGLSVRHQSLGSDQLRDTGEVRRLDAGAFLHGEAASLPLPGTPTLSAALRVHFDGGEGDWLAAHDVTLRLPLGPVRLHASHRSSFSPPSAGDQFFREGVGVVPNPDLRAERVPDEAEVGAALRFGGGSLTGTVEGEVFRGDLRGMIIWAPDFRFVWSPRNVDVRRRGGELRGDVRHRPSGVRVGGHVSRTDVTYFRNGQDSRVQVIYRPRDAGSLFLALEPGPVSLEVRATYTGTRYPVAAVVNALDPFWTLGATVSAQFAVGGWRVQPLMRVDRLLNETDPFIFAFPEPGRTVRFELRISPARTLSSLP